MLVGIPKEIKTHEYRVGMTPPGERELTQRGHKVPVETNAGHAIGIDDKNYQAAGAAIGADAAEVFARAELAIKVKEPQPQEISLLYEGQPLFTYFYLAPDAAQTEGLMGSGVTAIAYEMVSDDAGGLPLLAPMSEVAGRMSVQAGAACC